MTTPCEAADVTQSMAGLRHRPSQAKLRSTTHRRGIAAIDNDATPDAARPSERIERFSHGRDARIEAMTAVAPPRFWISAAWTMRPNSRSRISTTGRCLPPLIFLLFAVLLGPCTDGYNGARARFGFGGWERHEGG